MRKFHAYKFFRRTKEKLTYAYRAAAGKIQKTVLTASAIRVQHYC